MEKYLEIISKSRLFDKMEDEEISRVLDCLKPSISEYKKGECIALAGDKFKGIGIVLNGEISIMKENLDGRATMIDILNSGGMFGETIAFAKNGEVWPVTVMAQTMCEIMYIHPEKILSFCANVCSAHRMVTLNMLKIISNKALNLNKKIEYLMKKSIKGKLSMYLLEQHKKSGSLTFSITLNREKLAEFLNVSRPSMSRELCKMRDEGVIEFYKESIKIIDVEALKQLLNQ